MTLSYKVIKVLKKYITHQHQHQHHHAQQLGVLLDLTAITAGKN